MKRWVNREELIDMLCWARDQKHISEDALDVLIQNLSNIENKTEEEN